MRWNRISGGNLRASIRRIGAAGCLGSAMLSPAALAAPLSAQQAPGVPIILNTSGTVGPALDQLRQTLAGLQIKRWHAPNPVLGDAQANADSISRDLSDTLPPLLAAADAAPQSVPPAFAVYRNIEAAYDVLLRISGTADLAAPDREALDLTHALASLESARKTLGESILGATRTEESTLAELRATAAAPRPAAAPAQGGSSSRVVTDGPSATPAHKAKPKSSTSKPASSSTQSGAATSPQ